MKYLFLLLLFSWLCPCLAADLAADAALARQYVEQDSVVFLRAQRDDLQEYVFSGALPNELVLCRLESGHIHQSTLQLPLQEIIGARYVGETLVCWGPDAAGKTRLLRMSAGNAEDITPLAARRWLAPMFSIHYNGRLCLLLQMDDEPNPCAHVYWVDVAVKEPNLLLFHPNVHQAASVAISQRARTEAGLRWNEDGSKCLLDLRTANSREVLRLPAGEPLMLMGSAQESGYVYIMHSQGKEGLCLSNVCLTDGKQTMVAEFGRASVVGVLSDAQHRLLGVTRHWERYEYVPIQENAAVAACLRQAAQQFGSTAEVLPQALSPDEQRVLLQISPLAALSQHYVYEVAQNRFIPLVKSQQRVPIQPVHFAEYPARDGQKIPLYYTLPEGKGPFPTVVFVHGGPRMRTDAGYDWRVQFLVNRGFAVAQPQFRGSSGWGSSFMRAGYRQWGRGVMQHDVSDCVPWLVQQGIAASGKVAIMGGSYGGYAVTAALCFTPDLFACGISLFGPQDLAAFVRYSDKANAAYVSEDKEVIGNPDNPQQLEQLRAASPVYHADKIRKPLMLYYGGKDTLIPPREHSCRLVEAMRRAQVPVEVYTHDDEAHGFVHPDREPMLFARMVDFLQRHLYCGCNVMK